MSEIATIDAGLLRTDRKRFVREFGRAFDDIGFAKLANTSVPTDLIDASRRVTRDLFAHRDDVLKRWETPINGRATGFTPFKVEHSRDTPEDQADLKRFWHVRGPGQPWENLFPDDLVPQFGPVMVSLYSALEGLAFDLLGCLDEYLGLPTNTLPSMVRGGNTLLRVLDYPPVNGAGATGAVRSGKHTDINLITLLLPATARGLQVRAHDGSWFDANEEPGQIVVNAGDMLQLFLGGKLDAKWTVSGGRMKSTWHRVVNPADGEVDEGRNSFPLFVHPRGTVLLDPETGVMADHYLFQRLVEIGLMDTSVRDAFFTEHPLTRAIA